MSDNLNNMIDAYAAIKAAIANFEIQKKGMEKNFAELPAGAYESEQYRLTISDSLRAAPDGAMKEEIERIVEEFKATLSRQYLAAHTVETKVRTHRVGARNGKGLAA